ncbi:ATP-binding cassette domain-containing protein [Enterococcus sp. LJL128]|uniref:ATP-binding cassette domain-containing protein n=1 Tax=Enterococcus sp. LJL51 TaxID=3416656 RepID=UPI003CEDF434
MSAPVIDVKDLSKSFGTQTVLKNLNFQVGKGEVYSLLGMNGAGKTTVIKILTTLSHKDAGEAYVAGFDVEQEPRSVEEAISLTGQFTAVDELFTAQENLVMIGRLRHLKDAKEAALALLEQFRLLDAKDQLVASFSGGMKRRLDIAMSLIGNPQIIFLDEPTTGLDPKSRLEVWGLIRKLKEAGVTIFLTTQYIEEAEQLADRVGILKEGRLIAEGTPKELKDTVEENGVELGFYTKNDYEKAVVLLAAYSIRENVEELNIQVLTNGSAKEFALVLGMLETAGLELRAFSKIESRLEDVFLKIVEKGAA